MVTTGKVRAAVVQAAPAAFDLQATLSRVADLVAEAAQGGVDLVVFPEAFVGGYPKGHDFGAKVGTRSAAGRAWFARYWQSSIDVPGRETEAIGELARAHNSHIVIGVIERDAGTLYCTALMFNRDGALTGRHRKLVPTAVERLVWGRGDGATLTVADTDVGKCGSLARAQRRSRSRAHPAACGPEAAERQMCRCRDKNVAARFEMSREASFSSCNQAFTALAPRLQLVAPGGCAP